MVPFSNSPECDVATNIPLNGGHNQLSTCAEMRKSKDRKCRELRFDFTINEVHFVPKLCELSEDEIDSQWLGFFDYEIIKRRNQALAKRMICGTFPYEKMGVYTLRGLDCLSIKGSKFRRTQRALAAATLKREQERQKKSGIIDSETLALLMQEATLASVEMAIEMGNRDVQALSVADDQIIQCCDDNECTSFNDVDSVEFESFDEGFIELEPVPAVSTCNTSINTASRTKRRFPFYLKPFWRKTSSPR